MPLCTGTFPSMLQRGREGVNGDERRVENGVKEEKVREGSERKKMRGK